MLTFTFLSKFLNILSNNSYYRPNVNGELVIMLYPVINFVSTSYNDSVPYEVIIRDNDANHVNIYTLLNVTLNEFVSSSQIA